jgi:hypothetical protein
MKLPTFARIKRYLFSAEQWYLGTPERALDQAYNAALRIKRIEDEHFGGNQISLDARHSNNVSNYFQAQLKKNLRMARMRLTEFRASNLFIDISKAKARPDNSITVIVPQDDKNYPDEYTLEANQYTSEVEVGDQFAAILEKLKFVDSILARYQVQRSDSPVPLSTASNGKSSRIRKNKSNVDLSINNPESIYESEFISDDLTTDVSKLDSSSFIPRSILRTANRFKKELDPGQETEEEIVKDFRNSQVRTRTAIRFVLLLIIVPLLTQQISKNFIFNPLFDHFKAGSQIEIMINSEVKEKILTEIEQFEGEIKFQSLIGQIPSPSPGELEEKLKTKALELAEEYKWEVSEPVKNISADALSLGVFTILIATGRQQIAVLKSFMDEVVYGLSDSAKAFIIILFTDTFVGFHSPHGWEVIIASTLGHFGLPENEAFINMFIATFPVMLDTVFKYWIFRYLNQISPSAVATYRNMNE